MLEIDKRRYHELHDLILQESNMFNIVHKYNRNDTIIIQSIFIDEIGRLLGDIDKQIYAKAGLVAVDLIRDQIAYRLKQLMMVTDDLMISTQYDDNPEYLPGDKIYESIKIYNEENKNHEKSKKM